MKINKVIKSKIERSYFFVTGKFDDLDTSYFINRIEEGVEAKDNLNFKTNVVGKHTSFTYFCADKEFLKLVCQFIDYLDFNNVTESGYTLSDAWGVKEEFGCYSKEHNHRPSYMSGIIYLNDHESKLYFPEIKEELTPEPGRFALFSAFLNHRTKRNLGKVRYCLPFNFRHIAIREEHKK